MVIYIVQCGTHDGITEQRFFSRISTAKSECRRLNKQLGFECYEVVERIVNQD